MPLTTNYKVVYCVATYLRYGVVVNNQISFHHFGTDNAPFEIGNKHTANGHVLIADSRR